MFSRDRLVFNLSIIGNLALILPLFYYKTIYHPNSNGPYTFNYYFTNFKY